MRLDFYLPKHKVFIECQGRQHFTPVEKFGGEKSFLETQKRDKIKYELCIENNIKPIYFTDKKWKIFNGEKTINNEKELLEKLNEKN